MYLFKAFHNHQLFNCDSDHLPCKLLQMLYLPCTKFGTSRIRACSHLQKSCLGLSLLLIHIQVSLKREKKFCLHFDHLYEEPKVAETIVNVDSKTEQVL